MFGLIPFRVNNVNKINDVDTLFDNFIQNFFKDDFFNMPTIAGNFKADIRETNNEYLVEAELPGINKEDIELEYNDNNLTIKARRDEIIEKNEGNFVQKERSYGEFSRSFYVTNVNKDGIQARFKDGMLQIIMPKLNNQQSNSNRITIQ